MRKLRGRGDETALGGRVFFFGSKSSKFACLNFFLLSSPWVVLFWVVRRTLYLGGYIWWKKRHRKRKKNGFSFLKFEFFFFCKKWCKKVRNSNRGTSLGMSVCNEFKFKHALWRWDRKLVFTTATRRTAFFLFFRHHHHKKTFQPHQPPTGCSYYCF